MLKLWRQIQCKPWAFGWPFERCLSIFKQKQTNVQTVTAVFMCSVGCGLSWEHLLKWAGGWIFLFLFKNSWLNLERKQMRLGNSDFLSFLRKSDLLKHVTRCYCHNKWWPLDLVEGDFSFFFSSHFDCFCIAQLYLSSTFIFLLEISI